MRLGSAPECALLDRIETDFDAGVTGERPAHGIGMGRFRSERLPQGRDAGLRLSAN
jgi:hypothetical protein